MTCQGSPGKQALSLKMSDVDDGVWGLGLYDMPAGWGATGIKFWGTPKKELKITGFLQGLPCKLIVLTNRLTASSRNLSIFLRTTLCECE